MAQQLRPVRFRVSGNARITVAGRHDYMHGNAICAAKRKIIDLLRSTWGFAGKSEPLLLAKRIDCACVADVWASDEGDFRRFRGWKAVRMVYRHQKTGGMEQGRGHDSQSARHARWNGAKPCALKISSMSASA